MNRPALVLSALALLGPALFASPLENQKPKIENPTWWAFVPPKKPPIPADPKRKTKNESPIDRFVAARLNAQRLTLAPEADRRTLIRRLTFDLTGLPPTPEDVEAYLADRSHRSYENLVDRLLASPQYGERWGRHWLDVVRFGETDGGEHNYERFNAWPYRDYVIDAFNRDLPYNQFIREQIAGDLLSPGDRSKHAATGFLVAGPWDEVSANLNKDAAMRKQARMDELDDMVTAVSATFLGLTVNCARCHDHKFDPIPTRDYYRMAAAFSGAGFGERSIATDSEKAEYEAKTRPLRDQLAPLDRELAAIEETVAPPLLLAKYRAYDAARQGEKQRIPLNPLYNRNVFPPVTASRFRLVIQGQASGQPRIDKLELQPAGFKLQAWAAASPASIDSPVVLPLDLDRRQAVSEMAWSTSAKNSRDGMITIYKLEYSDNGVDWKTLCASTDHVSRLEADLPALSESEIESALSAEQRNRRFDLRRRRAELQAQIDRILTPPRLYAVNPRAREKVHLLERGSVSKPLEELTPGALTCISTLPSDLSVGNPIHNPKSKIQNDSRLALADWIADSRNPLTARVIVNRFWYYHFGNGIVNTPSDFGVMGDRPSHPELLDWLAISFMENGWSLKWLHRQILTSRVYRQSARFDSRAHDLDAGNRLLWRMPLKRMDAETLRDSILHISGNLNLKAGGPSFMLQKKGDRGSYIYKALDNDGPEVWRRAVYRFVVRGGERTLLDSFDCPDPSVATPQRQVSNTPVQALTLMNNAFVIRQSRLFAERLERERPGDRGAQVRRAYLLAYGRPPSSVESARALKYLQYHPISHLCRAILNSNEFINVP